MKQGIWLFCLLALFSAGAVEAHAAGRVTAEEKQVAQHPYDYALRTRLRDSYTNSKEYGSAYWHAAWLAWLGPQAERQMNIEFMHNRENASQARKQAYESLAIVLEVDGASRMMEESCLNGTIAQQANRLRREFVETLASLEKQNAASERGDPVVRMGLAHYAILLDDVFQLEGGKNAERQRLLRKAATWASAVTLQLPEAPGAHRTLAIIRARQADLGNDAGQWELAIEEAGRAYALDENDPSLPAFLWGLNLRAGRWEEAEQWQTRVAEMGACSINTTQ